MRKLALTAGVVAAFAAGPAATAGARAGMTSRSSAQR
jgi:hypothetical protein